MTTVVLVSIGVLLAAASSLMTMWYGGTAFGQGKNQADAARLVNEGAQIEKATDLYRSATGNSPDAVNAADPMQPLLDRHFMVKHPMGDNGPWVMDYANRMIRADVGAQGDPRAQAVCRAARKAQSLPNPATVYSCDGSDYPGTHPPGQLPANEPCCVWKDAAAAGSGSGTGGSGTIPSGSLPTLPPAT